MCPTGGEAAPYKALPGLPTKPLSLRLCLGERVRYLIIMGMLPSPLFPTIIQGISRILPYGRAPHSL